MFVLGELTASLQTVSAATGKRQHSFMYSCMGRKICRTSFMKTHAIGLFTLRTLQDQVEGGQVTLPPHKSAGRVAVNVLPPDMADNIGKFIHNYAAMHGMPQPAAPRGRPDRPPVYLPASVNKKKNCLPSSRSMLAPG